MGNKGTILTTRAAGIKTVSITLNMSPGTAGTYTQGSKYNARYATTQSGPAVPSTTPFDQPSSPFNGNIVGVSMALKMVSGANNFKNKLVAIISPPKSLGYSPPFARSQEITNQLVFDRTKGELFECRIPIRKGELFTIQFQNAQFGATPVSFQVEFVVFIESTDSEIETGLLTETQTLHFNYSAGGITFNDNTFRQIPAWQWGSGPAENTYNAPGFHVSRLTGYITGFIIGTQSNTTTQEEFTLEIHFANNYIRQSQGNTYIVPVGRFSMFSSASCSNGFIPCRIPINRHEAFYVVVRSQNMATNPTSWQVSVDAIIEGSSEGKRGAIVGKYQYGSKNADFIFAYNANEVLPNNVIRFAPCPMQGGVNWSSTPISCHVSPYDGIMCESTFSMISVTAFNSRHDVEYGYAFLNDQMAVISYNPGTLLKQVQLGTSGAWTRIYKHIIPIKKGQRFIPYIKTPTFSSVGTIRMYCMAHIRGN